MKQFYKSILLFIPFSLIIYFVLIIIVGEVPIQLIKPNINYRKGSYGHMFTRINDIKNYKNIDILFLGSSHSYRGFDTRIFEKHNLKVFNLGSSNQTPIQTNILLKRYLKDLNPKMIILEVSPWSMSNDGVESAVDLIANDKNDISSLVELIHFNNIKTINTALFAFYKNYINKGENFVENRRKLDDTYIHGGYVEKDLSYFEPVNNKIPTQKIEYNAKQISALNQLINLIKTQNIKLILVNTPIRKTLYNSYSNYDDFNKKMKVFGEYYNFNNLLNLNDSIHFYDNEHLNQRGVKIFNEKLIKTLDL